MDQTSTRADDVLVGLDGSASSRAALTWAAAYARSYTFRLHVLHVVDFGPGSPEVWAPGYGNVGFVVGFGSAESEQPELEALFAAIDPEPGWLMSSVDGAPGPELVRASAGARLLVVGTREHTGLARMLEGSVSHYCLSRATCPVVAVPAPVALDVTARKQEPDLTAREKLKQAAMMITLP